MNYWSRNLGAFISHLFQLVVVQILLGKLHAQFNLELSVIEESPSNTLIGNLNNFTPVKGLTESYPTTSSTFQLLSQTTLFWLNDTTGELFTRVPIDRESVCSETQSTLGRIVEPEQPLSPLLYETRLSDFPADSVCRIQLQVLHFTQGSLSAQEESQSHRVIILGITILDINDNPPSWYENAIHISIPEHSPIGSRFPLPAAFDPDCGLMNTTVSYSLWDSANRREIGTEYTSQYDHDAFQLDTETIPSSNSAEYGHALWNGHSAVCTRRSFKLWLRIVRDLDYDAIPNLLPGRRNVNYHSGSLHMRQSQLQLRAIDGGQPVALTGAVVVNINVTDINDHEPVFKLSRSKQQEREGKTSTTPVQSEEVIQVEENSPIGRIIYTAQATDVDELDNSQLIYSLDTSASSLVRSMFQINAKSGEVSLHQSPDFEQYKSFNVPLTVTDGKHRAFLNLLVMIINQNDHQPVITVQPVGQPRREDSNFPIQKSPSSVKTHFGHSKSVTLYITEHEPPGRFVATVTVADVDDSAGLENASGLKSHPQPSTYQRGHAYFAKDTPESTIRCQISHTGFGLSPLFEGAVNQYKLLTKTTFDREQQSEQFATLTCFDRGQPPLSAQMGLHIVIEDVNDHAPIFKHSRMMVDFKENEPVGTKVYVVEATDPDWGVNAQLGFNLAPEDTSDFMIDPTSGVVTSLRSFDREQQSHFNLTVFVKDHVDYAKHTNISPYHKSVTMTSGPYQTEDPASTGGHLIKGNLIVHIQDVNDCPPMFANSLYQISVSEDAKINLLIGQIKANDSDATETNNQIHYVIKHQSENRAVQEFRVSPQGYIYIARGNLDREKVSSYNFYLVAIDSGTPPLSSSTQVHIYVTDVNDNAPTWIFPVHNNQAINMTISEPVGYCLAKLKASDPDEGENGSVIYRLVQTSKMTNKDIFDGSAASMMGSHVNPTADAFRYQTTLEENGQSNLPGVNAPPAGNLFELDPSSGAIYVGRSMNLNDVGSVKLVVEASDGGQPAKVNHRVLQINIFRYLTQQPVFATVDTESASFNSADKSRYRLTSATNGGGHIENDLIVIIIMVAVTLIISLVLIVAILFLRCGICPNRAFGRYNSTIPNDYRPELAHPHHHLEEVFRDSGNMEVDGLLVPGLERLGNCTQFNEASLNSFQQKNENEPMCRSYLSNPGLDPWTGTTMSPKKLGQSGYETMKCNRFGGTMTFIHSPVGKPNTLRRASVINTSKRLDERIFGSPSATSSPDHEMKVMLTKRSTPRASVTVCDPFRASCSHLASARVGTPGLVVGKAEDMQSMDSGHGHSSSTENGMLSSLDPPSCRTKLQTHLSTFRCTTPQTFGRGTVKSACTKHPSEPQTPDSDSPHGTIPTLRQRSGTLPLSVSGDTIASLMIAKSSTDLSNHKDTDIKAVMSATQSSQTAKTRQSVSWLDPEDYQTCSQPSQVTRLTSANPRHSPSCHLNAPSEMNESIEGTLVLFSPVDPLGYAQLVHSAQSAAACERNSPKRSAYSAFPTSFV